MKDTLEIRGQTQTEGEETAKGVSRKWKPKGGRGIFDCFKTNVVIKDKEGRYIKTVVNQQDNITLINIYAPNTEAPK